MLSFLYKLVQIVLASVFGLVPASFWRTTARLVPVAPAAVEQNDRDEIESPRPEPFWPRAVFDQNERIMDLSDMIVAINGDEVTCKCLYTSTYTQS